MGQLGTRAVCSALLTSIVNGKPRMDECGVQAGRTTESGSVNQGSSASPCAIQGGNPCPPA